MKKIFRIEFALILAVGLCISLFMPTQPVSAQPSHEIIEGIFPDGTPWAVVAPEPLDLWNGTIILDLDALTFAPIMDSQHLVPVKWLVSEGYAYGGIIRNVVGYDFKKAVDYLLVVRQTFIEYYGQTPSRTIAFGLSRGSFVARKCMEFYPDIFDAALVWGGGGAGEINTALRIFDGPWVLKTLVDPESPLKIVGISNTSAEIGAEDAALTELVNLADSTPEGRARFSLAAAVQQFGPWTVPGSPEPAAKDYDAQYEQLISPIYWGVLNYVYNNPALVMAGLEEYAGGIVAWNNDVNYNQKMLARSGRKDFVVAMYSKAGLGLKGLMADLRTLEKSPRIHADPEAVAKIERAGTYTGEIYGPIMNVDSIGDGVDPQSCKKAYANTLRRAGNNKLLRIAWVHSAGHCHETLLEKAAAFVTLINRLDTGKWGDTSARAMNELAFRILSETGPDLIPTTDPRFIENHGVRQLLRPWDVSDWDSYQP
ncbi:MAG: hypothetical protein JW932_16790 [Deltaproteobacteria bacterium]|nr:hypothetical protein [Deltaproteobacteria bacterium]